MNHTLSVRQKAVCDVSDLTFVRGARGDTIEVSFDSEWEPMERIEAVFSNGARSVPVPLEGGSCKVPASVTSRLGEVHLTLAGYDDQNENARIVTQRMSRPFEVVEPGVVFHDPEEPSGSYEAGEGIVIDGLVISAEVTQSELDAQKVIEIPISFIEAL